MPTYTRRPLAINDETVTELRAIAAELEQLDPTLAALGGRLYRARKALEDDIGRAGDVWDNELAWLMDESGSDLAHANAMRLIAHLSFATDCLPGDDAEPDWYKRITTEAVAV